MGRRRYGRRVVETAREGKRLLPGITKGDLISYHERMADHMLPYLKARPLVLQCFPDGAGADGFYRKQAPPGAPRWLPTVRMRLKTRARRQDLVVCDGVAALGYLVGQACFTLHPWLSRRDRPDHPDQIVIDLDPPTDDFTVVCRAALQVRDLLDELGLPSFPKLTGSKGVHVHVPLDRSAPFDAVRAFARAAMDVLAARHPDALTTAQRKDQRRGRLYLDVARNAYGQTAVAPWSVRPLPGAPLAAPVAWRDLERGRVGPRDYTVDNVFRRLAQRDDPWAGMMRHARSLNGPRRRLERLAAPADA